MTDINKTAASATLHCLTGCAIGEILGMIISSALGWAAAPSIAISFLLAFVFGYALSARSLLKNNLGLKKSFKIAFAADSVSILIMEIADNGFLAIVPGALYAGLTTGLFWLSLFLSLVVAFLAAFPVNRFLIARGKGHALTHTYHRHNHN